MMPSEQAMLKVIGVQETGSIALVFNDFVPVSFFNRDMDCPVPLYWRTGDMGKQLLEIASGRNLSGDLPTIFGGRRRGSARA